MSKRLTDTEKWSDAWFIELSREEKLFFYCLIDQVDNAGFLELSFRKIKFDLEFNEDEILGAIKGLSRGLILFNEGLKNRDIIYLKNYLKHQKNYPLNPFNSFHNNALKIFEQRFELVKNSDYLSNIKVSGLNKKTNEKIEEILLNHLEKKQGLVSPLVKVEVKVKEEVKVDFGKSENLLQPQIEIDKIFLNQILDFFSIHESQEENVSRFLFAKHNRKEFEEFKTQTLAYIEFKKISGQEIHNWNNYKLSWREKDYSNALKNLKSKEVKTEKISSRADKNLQALQNARKMIRDRG